MNLVLKRHYFTTNYHLGCIKGEKGLVRISLHFCSHVFQVCFHALCISVCMLYINCALSLIPVRSCLVCNSHLRFTRYCFLWSFSQNKVALSFYLCWTFWAYILTCHVKLNDNISVRYTKAWKVSEEKKKILLLCSYLYSLKYYSNKMLFEKETYLEPDKLGHILAHGYKDLVIR